MVEVIPDSSKTHWVNRAPVGIRPYLQLSRLDRPVGYWLLALPGWIGLAFAGLSTSFNSMDFVWAALILIGAIAMRGAGCTYNDIVDQDLDAQVERTALRPLPAGTVTTKQAWIWTFIQIGIGFCVWLALPLLAKGIALLALPLVAAYPFMKRITWFPQVWLGLTFNWAVLVALAAKTGHVNLGLYIALVFWTIGYDTIYACQDIEDDAMVGIKSTARKFGKRIKLGVGICYSACLLIIGFGLKYNPVQGGTLFGTWYDSLSPLQQKSSLALHGPGFHVVTFAAVLLTLSLPTIHMIWQLKSFDVHHPKSALKAFKSNVAFALLLIVSLILLRAGVLEYDQFTIKNTLIIDDVAPLTQL